MDVDYAAELEKAQQVAQAVSCLEGFISELGCRYEPLIVALVRLQHGLVVVEVNGEPVEGGKKLIGGLYDAIDDLSKVICKLQLEIQMEV